MEKQTPKQEQQTTQEKINYYLIKLQKLEFPATQSQDLIKNYITNLLNILNQNFRDEKTIFETLSQLEKNYKRIKLGGKLLGKTTVQDFLNYYKNELKDLIVIKHFGQIKIAIAVKLIDKIAQSIVN